MFLLFFGFVDIMRRFQTVDRGNGLTYIYIYIDAAPIDWRDKMPGSAS